MKKQQNKRRDEHIVVRPVRRKKIDADKIALAYWLLAKRIIEDKSTRSSESRGVPDSTPQTERSEGEAA
jgi:hypothetical protein